jgi:hypothetical protein
LCGPVNVTCSMQRCVSAPASSGRRANEERKRPISDGEMAAKEALATVAVAEAHIDTLRKCLRRFEADNAAQAAEIVRLTEQAAALEERSNGAASRRRQLEDELTAVREQTAELEARLRASETTVQNWKTAANVHEAHAARAAEAEQAQKEQYDEQRASAEAAQRQVAEWKEEGSKARAAEARAAERVAALEAELAALRAEQQTTAEATDRAARQAEATYAALRAEAEADMRRQCDERLWQRAADLENLLNVQVAEMGKKHAVALAHAARASETTMAALTATLESHAQEEERLRRRIAELEEECSHATDRTAQEAQAEYDARWTEASVGLRRECDERVRRETERMEEALKSQVAEMKQKHAEALAHAARDSATTIGGLKAQLEETHSEYRRRREEQAKLQSESDARKEEDRREARAAEARAAKQVAALEAELTALRAEQPTTAEAIVRAAQRECDERVRRETDAMEETLRSVIADREQKHAEALAHAARDSETTIGGLKAMLEEAHSREKHLHSRIEELEKECARVVRAAEATTAEATEQAARQAARHAKAEAELRRQCDERVRRETEMMEEALKSRVAEMQRRMNEHAEALAHAAHENGKRDEETNREQRSADVKQRWDDERSALQRECARQVKALETTHRTFAAQLEARLRRECEDALALLRSEKQELERRLQARGSGPGSGAAAACKRRREDPEPPGRTSDDEACAAKQSRPTGSDSWSAGPVPLFVGLRAGRSLAPIA